MPGSVRDLPGGARGLSGDGKNGPERSAVFVCFGARAVRRGAMERSAFAVGDHAAADGAGAANRGGDCDGGAGDCVRVVFHTVWAESAGYIVGVRAVHRRARDLPDVCAGRRGGFLVLCIFRILSGGAEFVARTSVVGSSNP